MTSTNLLNKNNQNNPNKNFASLEQGNAYSMMTSKKNADALVNKPNIMDKNVNVDVLDTIENVNDIKNKSFLNQDYTFLSLTKENVDTIDKTKINTNENDDLKQTYNELLKEYEDVLKNIQENINDYLKRTSPNNPYLNKLIRFSTNEIAYVTNLGVVKLISDNKIIEKLQIPKNIINVNIPFIDNYLTPGTKIPTNPPLVAGTPLRKNETIGNEGQNVYVNNLFKKGVKSSYLGCYDDANIINMEFIGKKPPVNLIKNGNFEQPFLRKDSFNYYNDNTSVPNWTFQGTAAIINESNSWRYKMPYPNGSQCVSIQKDASIMQRVSLEKGMYVLSFFACGRDCCNQPPASNPIDIKLGDKVIYNFIPIINVWKKYIVPVTVDNNGKYNIVFKGLTMNNDQSSAIQNIVLLSQNVNMDGNYTMNMCKEEALNGGYKYFGLQSVNKNESKGFCQLGNNESTKRNLKNKPKSNACIKMNDGNNGGALGTTALYEFDSLGYKNNIGNFGYVGPNAELYAYNSKDITYTNTYNKQSNFDKMGNLGGSGSALSGTTVNKCQEMCNTKNNCAGFSFNRSTNTCTLKSNMIERNPLKRANNVDLYERNKQLKNNSIPYGITNNVINIDSVDYQYYNKGTNYKNSIYTLPNINKQLIKKKNELESKLKNVLTQIANNAALYKSNNENVVSKTKTNYDINKDYLKELETLKEKIRTFDKENNIQNILNDSDIVMTHNNYMYMTWSILAMSGLILYLGMSKRQEM